MEFIFKKWAAKELRKLDFPIRVRILKKLKFYTSQESPLRFAESIADPRFGNWRFRIGDYRVLFDVENNRIVILKVGHRKDIYK
jgi:mRNA interferase RelE/StbE